ncbi:hypothetical protein Tco_0502306 [Tanacetum coccineum]
MSSRHYDGGDGSRGRGDNTEDRSSHKDASHDKMKGNVIEESGFYSEDDELDDVSIVADIGGCELQNLTSQISDLSYLQEKSLLIGSFTTDDTMLIDEED